MNKFGMARAVALAIAVSVIVGASVFGLEPRGQSIGPPVNGSSSSGDPRQSPNTGPFTINLERHHYSDTIDHFAQVIIGGQKFRLNFDTSSGQVWVPSRKPADARLHYERGHICNDPTCLFSNLLGFEKYRGIKLSGHKLSDEFTIEVRPIGSSGSRQVKFPHKFISVNEASDYQLRDKVYDGVIGLLPENTPTRNILRSIFGDDGPLVIGFWFNDNIFSEDLGGEISMGEPHSTKYVGDIRYMKSSSAHEWKLPLINIKIGSTTLSGSHASFDTGSFSTKAPRSELQPIMKEMKATFKESLGRYVVDCDSYSSLPELYFRFGGDRRRVYLPIAGTDFNGERICYVNIEPMDDGENNWSFGTHFMVSYYTVFNYNTGEIGLAQSRPA